MKKIYFAMALFFGAIMMLSSFSGNAPAGRTGAPGEGFCTDCHVPSNPAQNGTVALRGFPETITPNQTYALEVVLKVTAGDPESGGFSMTILDGSDNQAGLLENPGPDAALRESSNRQYVGHNPAISIGDSVTWTVDWVAPDLAVGETISYYIAGNFANGAGGNSGDRIVSATGNGMMGTTSSNKLIAENNIQVYPNPATDLVNVTLEDQSIVRQVNVISMSGQTMITDRSGSNTVDVSTLPNGFFVMQVETSTGVYTSKLMK